MKAVGIDYGERRVGVAVSNEEGTFAFPKMTLPNNPMLIPDLVAFIKKENIQTIVVGHSQNLSGGENPIMESARHFVKGLERETGLAVEFEPEFYTSVEARRLKGTEGAVDAEAAAIILGSYLNRKKPHDDFA